MCGKQACRRCSSLLVKVCCDCRTVVNSLFFNSAPSNEKPSYLLLTWSSAVLRYLPPCQPSKMTIFPKKQDLSLNFPTTTAVLSPWWCFLGTRAPSLFFLPKAGSEELSMASLDSEDHWSCIELHGHSVSRRSLPGSAVPHSLVPSYSSAVLSFRKTLIVLFSQILVPLASVNSEMHKRHTCRLKHNVQYLL